MLINNFRPGVMDSLGLGKEDCKTLNKNLKILGVTVLTSLNNISLKQIGYTKNVNQLVLKQANLIKKTNCDGIVCSAQEAMIVRKRYKNFLLQQVEK